MSNGIPRGWSLAKIGDIAHYVRGVTYSKTLASNSPGDGLTAVLRANNIQVGLVFDDLVFVPDRFISADQVVQHGDVVIAMSSGSKSVVGKAALAKTPPRCGFGAFCGVIRPSPNVEHGLLGYYFQTQSYRNAVADESKGVNINNLKAEHVLGRELALPPVNEQRRIVSKINELFSRIDEGEVALARVEKLVERYRQSVLKAAVTGELTRDWRAARKRAGEPVESGAALLARILKARRATWEAAELAKLKAKGKPPTDDRWKQKYTEPEPPHTTDLPELPDGWVWASMDQLTTKITSGSRDWKAYYGRGEGVFVMAQNVRPGRFDMTDVQRVDPPDGDRDAERSEIAKGDLLITIVGANTGDVCRVERPVTRHYVCQSVALMRLANVSLSEYIAVYLNTKDAGRAELDKEIYGAGRPHLSFDQLRAIRVPIPPVSERAAILDSLSDSESQLSDVRGNLTGLTRTSGALRQSILKAAFSGQLVPQDPHDEPASKLLERIATERATAPALRQRKKKSA